MQMRHIQFGLLHCYPLNNMLQYWNKINACNLRDEKILAINPDYGAGLGQIADGFINSFLGSQVIGTLPTF